MCIYTGSAVGGASCMRMISYYVLNQHPAAVRGRGKYRLAGANRGKRVTAVAHRKVDWGEGGHISNSYMYD